MAEKKPIIIRLDRNSKVPVRQAIFASQFALKDDLAQNGIVEIIFKPATGLVVSHCVAFDTIILRDNSQTFTTYLAGLSEEPDDSAVNAKLPSHGENYYSNCLQIAQSGGRAEMWFGHVALHEIAEATRRGKAGEDYPIVVNPLIAVYSTVGFQKKLISEIFAVLGFET